MKEFSNPDPDETGSAEWLGQLYNLGSSTVPPLENRNHESGTSSEAPNELVTLPHLYDCINNKAEALDIKPGTTMITQGDKWSVLNGAIPIADETIVVAKGSESLEAHEKPVIIAEGDGLVVVVHDPQNSIAGMLKMPLFHGGQDFRTTQLLGKMVDSMGPLSPEARAFVCDPKDFSPGEADFLNQSKEDKLAPKVANLHFKEVLSTKIGIHQENITTINDGYWQKIEVDPETGDVFVNSYIQEGDDPVTIKETRRHSPEQQPMIEDYAVQPFLGQASLNNILYATSVFLNQPATKSSNWLKPAENAETKNLELNKYSIRPSSILNTNPESDEVCFGFDLIQEGVDKPAGQISMKMDRGFVQITELSKVSCTPDQQIDAVASLCEAGLTVAKISNYRVAIIDVVELASDAIEHSPGVIDIGELPEISLNFNSEAYQYYTEMYNNMAQRLGFQEMGDGLWRRALG